MISRVLRKYFDAYFVDNQIFILKFTEVLKMKKTLFPSNINSSIWHSKSHSPIFASLQRFIQPVGLMMAFFFVATASAQSAKKEKAPIIDARTYLSQKLYSRTEVDHWIAGSGCQFAKFDSEVGWLLHDARWEGSVNNMLKSNGVNGATWATSFDHDKNYRRHMIAYADQPCRINTYGDSFTHCDQVNDGETWQEFLASHLREPVRNFGVGGYSVYQAYLRMLREEKTAPADLIIFNIFEDDHNRSIGAWGTLRAGKDWRFFWPTEPYLTVDFSTGKSVGHKNVCQTAEMFYNLCDLDWVEKQFRDDFTLGIMLADVNARAGNEDEAWKILEKTAIAYGLKEGISHTGSALDAIWKLHRRAALLSSMQVVEWVEAFAKQSNKKVLYVLSYGGGFSPEGPRFDQAFVDFMNSKGVPYIDLLTAHRSDFSKFKGSIEEYRNRYWNGHYNASGNFFTALAIRDKVVSMLNPKSPAYQPL
jgi:hypothetical protein